MRKFTLLALLLTTSAFAEDHWCLNNNISFFGDYAYLRRSEIRDKRLVEDVSTFQVINGEIKGKNVMNTKQLVGRFDWESALRAGMMIHHSSGSSFEFLYQYVWPYSTTKTVLAQGTLRFPFKESDFTQDFIDADQAKGSYLSQFQNAEVNFWACVTPRRINYFSFYWLIGARFIYLKEKFDLAFTKQGRTSDYDIETKNNLYGGQLGFNFDINPTCRWTFSVRLKGAMFYNDARNKVFLGDFNNTIVLRNFRRDKETASFLIDGFGQVTFHTNPFFDVYVAYQGLLLSGLMLAPEQIDESSNLQSNHASNKGQIVLDGIYAGVMISF